MPIRLQWTELNATDRGLHHPHMAKDANGTEYRIRPVFYRGGRFAGWRLTIGRTQQLRGMKTMLHEAKASAQRYADRQRNESLKAARSRASGKRVLHLDDVAPLEISIPVYSRVLDLE